MLNLVLMNDVELEEYFEQTWHEYFQELVSAGTSEAEAKLDIERNKESMFKDGKLTDCHRIFNVVQDEAVVGILWLAERIPKEWFIYDIAVKEKFRGQGLGKATMRSAEEFVRSNGGTEISLSVFGNNKIARNLYESLGYETLRLAMKKIL